MSKKIKKKPDLKTQVFLVRPVFAVGFNKRYSAAIASVGQESTHAPQSVHFAGSITCVPSFSEIASTGQSATQAPQFTQESLIL
jgi:hypothetical protein